MKTKIPSLVLRALFGVALLSVAGIGSAGSVPGPHSIMVSSVFPAVTSIDFHFYPSAGVYFSLSTGHYYYPTPHGWHDLRSLPRHFHLDPRERVIVRGERYQPYLNHRSHQDRYRYHEDHHQGDSWRRDHHDGGKGHREHDRYGRDRG